MLVVRVPGPPPVKHVDMIEDPERIHEPDEGGYCEGRNQKRKLDAPRCLHAACSIDLRRFQQLSGNRFERSEEDEERERSPLEDFDPDDGGDNPRRAQEVRLNAQELQILGDHPDEIVQQEPIHDAQENRCHHEREKERGKERLVVRQQGLQRQRKAEAEKDFEHRRGDGKAGAEPQRAPEVRVLQHGNKVRQPDPLRRAQGPEHETGEAVVEVRAGRVSPQQQAENHQGGQKEQPPPALPPGYRLAHFFTLSKAYLLMVDVMRDAALERAASMLFWPAQTAESSSASI